MKTQPTQQQCRDILLRRLDLSEHEADHAMQPEPGMHYFNMHFPRFKCGAPACVAGHVEDIMQYDKRNLRNKYNYTTDYYLAVLEAGLGIHGDDASWLYWGAFSCGDDAEDITVDETLAELDRIFAVNPL